MEERKKKKYMREPWVGERDKLVGIWDYQYSCLEKPTDAGAWWATVDGVAKSRTRLSNFTFTFGINIYTLLYIKY